MGMTIAAAVVAFVSCSSGPYGNTDPWMRQYLDPPDRVWQAIEISLGELEYEVELSNRPDGKIKAASTSDEIDPPMVLLIDQVMRIDNHVKVYVKPADGDTESERFQTAATEFLAELDKQLKG